MTRELSKEIIFLEAHENLVAIVAKNKHFFFTERAEQNFEVLQNAFFQYKLRIFLNVYEVEEPCRGLSVKIYQVNFSIAKSP